MQFSELNKDAVALASFSPRPPMVLFAVFCCIYFPMLATLPLSIDSETTILSGNHFYWISQGRWGAYLVTLLFPPHLVPYFTLALFGVAVSAAYLFLVSACRLPLNWKAIVGFAMFSSFPIWSFILEFSSNVVQVGIGIFCCCLALWLLARRLDGGDRRAVSIAVEVTFLTFAISLYQAFAFVYPALILAHLLLVSRPASQGAVAVLHAFVALLAAVIAYSVIGTAFAAALGVPPGYVGDFIRIDAVLSDPTGTLSRTLFLALDAYSGAEALYGANLYATALISVLFICAMALRASAWQAFLALGLLTVPFVFVLTAGGERFPPRALLAIPVAMWAMSMVLLAAPAKWLRVTGAVAVGLTIFQSTAAISTYQAVRQLRSEFDTRIASQIYLGIAELADSRWQKVDFYGAIEAPRPLYSVGVDSTAAGSFFAWDGGNPGRILSYMHLLGYQDLVLLGKAEREDLMPLYEKMPVWPRPGSIRRYQDTVLVKLGERAGAY